MPRKAADSLPVLPLPLERLRPPETLSAGAKAEFLRIVSSERPQHFKLSDLPLLVQYTEACALAARAMCALQDDDAANAWLVRWEKATRTMVALSLRLRLSPQARQPNNPRAARTEPVSYYERMRLAGELEDGSQRSE